MPHRKKFFSSFREQNYEVWGFTLYFTLFCAVITLFLLLSYFQQIGIIQAVIFIMLSFVFWLADPWMKQHLPRHYSNIILMSIYFTMAQYLIYQTGKLHSPFYFFYLIIIITAAFHYGLRGSIFSSVFVLIGYASFADLQLDWIMVLQRWLILLIISFMIGFLAESKQRADSLFFQKSSKINTLNEIGKILSATLDIQKLFPLILDFTMSVANAAGGGLFLWDDSNKTYQLLLTEGIDPDEFIPVVDSKEGISFISYIEHHQEPVFIQRVSREKKFKHLPRTVRKKVKSLMAAPIIVHDKIVAFVIVVNKKIDEIFIGDDYEVFLIMVNQIAISIENAKLHQAMVEMKNYRDHLMGSIQTGVVAVDKQGTIRTVNKTAQDIFSMPENSIVGQTLSALSLFEDKIIKQSQQFGGEIKADVHTPDGRTVPVVMMVSPLSNEASEVIGKIMTIRDVTRVRELEKRMERAETLAELGEMAAGVAHEIRNPLGGIEGFAALLARDLSDDPDKKRLADQIVEGAKGLNRIVEQLLSYTNPRPTKKIFVDINKLIDTALLYCKEDLRKKNIHLTKKYYKKDSHLKIDPEKIKQVLLNIFRNSIEAFDNSGSIIVRTGIEKSYKTLNWMVITITDDGGGMSEDTRNKIFNPFFTTKQKGTGLGMAISNRIIHDHLGRIEVESEQGKGTAVKIFLPLHDKKENIVV